MASGPLHCVLRYIRQVSATSASADAELLRRYIQFQDEQAFTTLVERHGPLVLGVCRRVLRDCHDAEDAFQATFLVLARKARSVSQPECLASWLYRVAYRVAQRARSAAERHQHPAQLEDLPGAVTTPAVEWAELRLVLDEEINRLPEKYRLPFVLCYLQEVTNEEAASRLRCPTGTVASRLATARERLRARLTRRGIALTVGLTPALLAEHASSAVPATLLAATTGALISLSRAGMVSSKVMILADGVLNAMLLEKIMKLLGLAVLAGTLLTGAGLSLFGLQAQETDPRANAAQSREKKKPAPTAAAPREQIKMVTVEEVTDAFRNNDALADEMFSDQRVRVRGRVLSIKRVNFPAGELIYSLTLENAEDALGDETGPVVGPGPGGAPPAGIGPGLAPPRPSAPGPMRGPGGPGGIGFSPTPPRELLTFEFSKEERKELAQLRSGQVIIVEGRCDGPDAGDKNDQGPIRFRNSKIISTTRKDRK
jgi:RNA polymerase sigma factor (sigma-70 family)